MTQIQENSIDIQIMMDDLEFKPIYTTAGAAGADIKAYLQEPLVIEAGCSALVPTGLRVAIPSGFEIQIRPRSGLAFNHQITVLNTPGTIDEDYRGEIKVILINHGQHAFTITPGMRIAQMVLAPVMRANFLVSEELVETKRGEGGFGHTGKG